LVQSRIAVKLTLTLIGFVAVVVIVAGFYLDRRLDAIAIENLTTQLTRQAQLIERDTGAALGVQAPSEQTQQWLRSLASLTSARLTLVAANGLVLGDSERTVEGVTRMDNHRDRPEVREALTTGVGASRRRSDTTGVQTLYVAVRARDARGVVRLGYPLDEVARTTGAIRKAILVGGMLALIVAVGISLFVSRRLTHPVVSMERIAHRMAQGDFSAKAPGRSPDEIGQLGRALNSMATSLRTRIEELQGEQAKVAAILDSMVEGVIAVDAHNHVALINPSAARIFRTSHERSVGKPFLEVIRNKELHDLIRECHALATLDVIVREVHLYTPRERVLRVHAVTLGLHDEGPGVLLVLHDITELRQLEQVRTEFVANVSHELRTPLTAIRGYLETLTGGALEEPENARRFLEISLKHAERLGRLLDDLLDLSNIELGRVTLTLEPTELSSVVEQVMTIIQPRAQANQIALTATVSPGLPSVQADHDRLVQIFVNLLDNAVKFTNRGGSVSIAATREDSKIAVEVRDTGIGIPSTDLPRITERFYRVDRARSRELGGTGLGLAIVKHLVQAHGGELRIESELGKGTAVHFTLPLA
jgi:two-component system phosphate regulon sensor histidine kinase PhoR